MEHLTDEFGFSVPTREQLIKSAAHILQLQEGDVVEYVMVNDVVIEDREQQSAMLLVDERVQSVSVRAVNAGLPGSGKRY